MVITDSSGYVKAGVGMKSRQFLHKLHEKQSVWKQYPQYKKAVLPGRCLPEITARIGAAAVEGIQRCVVSYFLNDWKDFASTRSRFHDNVSRFGDALHQHCRTSFVFVGGCASMFKLPPAYDDAVNFVIETLRDMGIACNNAPETHQLPLCNDG